MIKLPADAWWLIIVTAVIVGWYIYNRGWERNL